MLLKVMLMSYNRGLEQYGSGPRIELCVFVWSLEKVSVNVNNTSATNNSHIVSDGDLSVVIAYGSISCKAR